MCKIYTGNTVEELTDLSDKDITGHTFELGSERLAVFKCRRVVKSSPKTAHSLRLHRIA